MDCENVMLGKNFSQYNVRIGKNSEEVRKRKLTWKKCQNEWGDCYKDMMILVAFLYLVWHF